MAHSDILVLVIAWVAVFLVLGQHVASVLLGAGLLGIWIAFGTRIFNGILAQDIISTASSYSLSIIPMYLLMAQALLRGGVVEDLFIVAHRMAGGRKFPLGVATIITGGLLGAVSGSGAATSASLAVMASPHLEKVGYTRRFSIALAAVAGSLSAIIPPSVIMIIYGSLTLVPVGHLFMGSVFPALVCIGVYIGCIALFGETNEKSPQDKAPEAETPLSARNIGAFAFVIGLMTVVFGGIYGGIVTAAEAGAIGAFVAVVGLVLMGRLKLTDIYGALSVSVSITAMLMMIVIGAQVFGRFLSLTRAPRALLESLEPLLIYPNLVVGLIMLTFFLFGLFLESAAVMVLLIPVIIPLLEVLQVDLIWFGVMASFMISLGLLTPPVGLSTFAACSAANHRVGPVFLTTGQFALVAAVIVGAVMMTFPAIVTWLPAQIK
jgi:C4-dicarboxylate transporter, DctM subunit